METINNHPNISHLPSGIDQLAEKVSKMTSEEYDKYLKLHQHAQASADSALRNYRKTHGWDGVPLGEKIKTISGKSPAELLQQLKNAKNDIEYQYARAEAVHANKLREGGYDEEIPYSLPDTEWRALCALCGEKAWDDYGYQFSEELFTDTNRRNIFKAFKYLSEDGQPININTAYTLFEKQGIHFPIIWLEWLTSTTQIYNLPYMLKELRTMAKRREYDNTFKAASALLEDGSVSLETIGERLRDVATDAPIEEISTMEEAGQEVLDTIRENAMYDKSVGTLTGFKMIDDMGGFMAGDLIVVAGDTSNGKTSLALSITLNAIIMGSKIAYYSMEMPKKRLASRILSIISKIPSSLMLRHKINLDDYDKIKEALDVMPRTELLFDDKSTIRFEDMLASIRMMANKYRVKGVVVDYLQILNVNSKGKDNQEHLMAEVARRLKNIAMECNIWVMALSQLNRDKLNPEPNLARLRDSGQIAEAADVVMFIYRPELYGKKYSGKTLIDNVKISEKSTKNTAQIEIAKGRDIGLGKCIVGFNPALTYFYDANIPLASEEEDNDQPLDPLNGVHITGSDMPHVYDQLDETTLPF